MNAFDYAINKVIDRVTYLKNGAIYIDASGSFWEKDYPLCVPASLIDDDLYFISKSECDKFKQYDFIVPDNIEYDANIRRPYYRMRGKPVTEEQAFDIIRRTDTFFNPLIPPNIISSFIWSCNFHNSLIENYNKSCCCGWIHTDGTVGCNATAYGCLEINAFLEEWLEKLINFPYLDLVIAITKWNEIPDAVNNADWGSDFFQKQLYEYAEYDAQFYDAVVLGIYVHDKTVEILKPTDAIEKYKEYASLYEKERKIYIPELYGDVVTKQIDLSFAKKCIEANGLLLETALSEVPEYVWRRLNV